MKIKSYRRIKIMRNWHNPNKYRMDDGNDEIPSNQLQPIIIQAPNNNQEQNISSGITITGNKIHFYSDIYDETVLILNKALIETDISLQNTKNILGDETVDPIIHLHLNTGGGSIYAAFATVDTIRNLKSKVHTHIDGYCASAGTLISSVGHKRTIGLYSSMLIHQLSGEMYGKFSEMEDSMFNSTLLMKSLKDFYKKYTKIPMKKLDELLKKDISLSAQECLDFGLVDMIR